MARWCLVAADAQKAVLRTIATKTTSFVLLNIFYLLVERRDFTVVNSSVGQQKEDWHTCKTRYVEHLNLVDEDTLLVSLSDKIHNARSILRDLRKPEIGKAVWDRFQNSRNDTLWYYRTLAKSFQRRVKDQSAKMQLANELSEMVDVLEKT